MVPWMAMNGAGMAYEGANYIGKHDTKCMSYHHCCHTDLLFHDIYVVWWGAFYLLFYGTIGTRRKPQDPSI